MQHLDALVARCAGRRLQIDLRVARHDADQNARPVAAQHERLEHALNRLAELLGHMDGCQIVLVHPVGDQLVMNFRAVQQTGRIRLAHFLSHASKPSFLRRR